MKLPFPSSIVSTSPNSQHVELDLSAGNQAPLTNFMNILSSAVRAANCNCEAAQ